MLTLEQGTEIKGEGLFSGRVEATGFTAKDPGSFRSIEMYDRGFAKSIGGNVTGGSEINASGSVGPSDFFTFTTFPAIESAPQSYSLRLHLLGRVVGDDEQSTSRFYNVIFRVDGDIGGFRDFHAALVSAADRNWPSGQAPVIVVDQGGNDIRVRVRNGTIGPPSPAVSFTITTDWIKIGSPHSI